MFLVMGFFERRKKTDEATEEAPDGPDFGDPPEHLAESIDATAMTDGDDDVDG